MAPLTLSNATRAQVHVRPLLSSLTRAVVLALVASVIPLGTAFAQTARFVRAATDATTVRLHQASDRDVVMMAPRGMVLEVIHTEGDRFTHRKSNWYWVLLPRDAWGTQRAGWVSGQQVEDVPPTETVASDTSNAGRGDVPAAPIGLNAAAGSVTYEAEQPVKPVAPAAPTEQPEVILNFEFAKSNLTDEARSKLSDAVSHLPPNARVSFALEGYADSIGPERFNQRLGLERAETVKRHLAEQHHIPADQIGVISFGEDKPAAPNDTQEGRAQNRRVVIKVAR